MHDQVPRPRMIAKHMISVCEKLMNGGDTALSVARDQQSPLRARHYSSDRAHGGRGHDHSEEDEDPGYNDQTGAVACARSSRKGTLYDSFVRSLRGLDLSLTRVDDTYEQIMGKAKRHEAQRKLREEGLPAGAGRCVACHEWMPGGEEQRIKDGLCPTHNRGLSRARKKGITRSDYVARVRRNQGVDLEDANET